MAIGSSHTEQGFSVQIFGAHIITPGAGGSGKGIRFHARLSVLP